MVSTVEPNISTTVVPSDSASGPGPETQPAAAVPAPVVTTNTTTKLPSAPIYLCLEYQTEENPFHPQHNAQKYCDLAAKVINTVEGIKNELSSELGQQEIIDLRIQQNQPLRGWRHVERNWYQVTQTNTTNGVASSQLKFPRLGSFEISIKLPCPPTSHQVLLGQIQPNYKEYLLFSKLEARKWPSLDFVSKVVKRVIRRKEELICSGNNNCTNQQQQPSGHSKFTMTSQQSTIPQAQQQLQYPPNSINTPNINNDSLLDPIIPKVSPRDSSTQARLQQPPMCFSLSPRGRSVQAQYMQVQAPGTPQLGTNSDANINVMSNSNIMSNSHSNSFNNSTSQSLNFQLNSTPRGQTQQQTPQFNRYDNNNSISIQDCNNPLAQKYGYGTGHKTKKGTTYYQKQNLNQNSNQQLQSHCQSGNNNSSDLSNTTMLPNLLNNNYTGSNSALAQTLSARKLRTRADALQFFHSAVSFRRYLPPMPTKFGFLAFKKALNSCFYLDLDESERILLWNTCCRGRCEITVEDLIPAAVTQDQNGINGGGPYPPSSNHNHGHSHTNETPRAKAIRIHHAKQKAAAQIQQAQKTVQEEQSGEMQDGIGNRSGEYQCYDNTESGGQQGNTNGNYSAKHNNIPKLKLNQKTPKPKGSTAPDTARSPKQQQQYQQDDGETPRRPSINSNYKNVKSSGYGRESNSCSNKNSNSIRSSTTPRKMSSQSGGPNGNNNIGTNSTNLSLTAQNGVQQVQQANEGQDQVNSARGPGKNGGSKSKGKGSARGQNIASGNGKKGQHNHHQQNNRDLDISDLPGYKVQSDKSGNTSIGATMAPPVENDMILETARTDISNNNFGLVSESQSQTPQIVNNNVENQQVKQPNAIDQSSLGQNQKSNTNQGQVQRPGSSPGKPTVTKTVQQRPTSAAPIRPQPGPQRPNSTGKNIVTNAKPSSESQPLLIKPLKTKHMALSDLCQALIQESLVVDSKYTGWVPRDYLLGIRVPKKVIEEVEQKKSNGMTNQNQNQNLTNTDKVLLSTLQLFKQQPLDFSLLQDRLGWAIRKFTPALLQFTSLEHICKDLEECWLEMDGPQQTDKDFEFVINDQSQFGADADPNVLNQIQIEGQVQGLVQGLADYDGDDFKNQIEIQQSGGNTNTKSSNRLLTTGPQAASLARPQTANLNGPSTHGLNDNMNQNSARSRSHGHTNSTGNNNISQTENNNITSSNAQSLKKVDARKDDPELLFPPVVTEEARKLYAELHSSYEEDEFEKDTEDNDQSVLTSSPSPNKNSVLKKLNNMNLNQDLEQKEQNLLNGGPIENSDINQQQLDSVTNNINNEYSNDFEIDNSDNLNIMEQSQPNPDQPFAEMPGCLGATQCTNTQCTNTQTCTTPIHNQDDLAVTIADAHQEELNNINECEQAQQGPVTLTETQNGNNNINNNNVNLNNTGTITGTYDSLSKSRPGIPNYLNQSSTNPVGSGNSSKDPVFNLNNTVLDNTVTMIGGNQDLDQGPEVTNVVDHHQDLNLTTSLLSKSHKHIDVNTNQKCDTANSSKQSAETVINDDVNNVGSDDNMNATMVNVDEALLIQASDVVNNEPNMNNLNVINNLQSTLLGTADTQETVTDNLNINKAVTAPAQTETSNPEIEAEAAVPELPPNEPLTNSTEPVIDELTDNIMYTVQGLPQNNVFNSNTNSQSDIINIQQITNNQPNHNMLGSVMDSVETAQDAIAVDQDDDVVQEAAAQENVDLNVIDDKKSVTGSNQSKDKPHEQNQMVENDVNVNVNEPSTVVAESVSDPNKADKSSRNGSKDTQKTEEPSDDPEQTNKNLNTNMDIDGEPDHDVLGLYKSAASGAVLIPQSQEVEKVETDSKVEVQSEVQSENVKNVVASLGAILGKPKASPEKSASKQSTTSTNKGNPIVPVAVAPSSFKPSSKGRPISTVSRPNGSKPKAAVPKSQSGASNSGGSNNSSRLGSKKSVHSAGSGGSGGGRSQSKKSGGNGGGVTTATAEVSKPAVPEVSAQEVPETTTVADNTLNQNLNATQDQANETHIQADPEVVNSTNVIGNMGTNLLDSQTTATEALTATNFTKSNQQSHAASTDSITNALQEVTIDGNTDGKKIENNVEESELPKFSNQDGVESDKNQDVVDKNQDVDDKDTSNDQNDEENNSDEPAPGAPPVFALNLQAPQENDPTFSGFKNLESLYVESDDITTNNPNNLNFKNQYYSIHNTNIVPDKSVSHSSTSNSASYGNDGFDDETPSDEGMSCGN